MNTRMNVIMASLAVVLMSGSAVSFAADDAAAANPHHKQFHKEMKQVFEACAKANGVALPAQGSGNSLSSGDRTAVQACVKQFHDSVRTCMQNAGVAKPQPGQRPQFSSADKASFEQCRSQAMAGISGSAAGK